MDISAVVLNKLIGQGSLDVWGKLKLAFLDPAYTSLYAFISKHYDKYGAIPTFEELEVATRDLTVSKTVSIIRLVDAPEVDAEVALDALIDKYTQTQALGLLNTFVDEVPMMSTEEVKEALSNIVVKLDEKTLTTESVFTMSDILLFQTAADISKDRTYLGINNTFDATLQGVAREELILLGGKRGSGKSITSSNVVTSQYEAGNTSVLFTIEMVAREIHERNFAILADVPYLALRQGNLTEEDLLKVLKVRAGMYVDADDLIEEFLQHRDRFKFESTLVRSKQLKPDNQIILIDDRALTITSIDLHLGKLKAKFGDKLRIAVVDYLNQIVVDSGSSQFDWQPQIVVAKKLKDLARKHQVTIFSPYQIDASGEARFAKGILDSADISLVMEPTEDSMIFNTTKIRGGPTMKFCSGIRWESLRISPVPKELPEKEEKPKKQAKETKVQESATDTPPWN